MDIVPKAYTLTFQPEVSVDLPMDWLRRFCLPLFCLCLLAGTYPAHAQGLQVKTYNARSYHEDDGLTSNEIYALTQAPSGEIWFGTKRGISSFDGLRWKLIEGSDSLVFHSKSKLYTFGDSVLQVSAHITGVYLSFRLFHQKRAYTLTQLPQKFTSHSYPSRIAVERTKTGFNFAVRIENHLWTLNYPHGKWQQTLLPEKLLKSKIHNLVYFHSNLLLLTDQGLYRFDIKKNQCSLLWPSTLGGKTVLAATPSADGQTLYLLGDDWLGEWKENKFRFLLNKIYQDKQSSFPYSTYNILSTRSGFLLLQHTNSIFLFNPRSGSVEPIRLSLAGTATSPTSMMEDSEGNLWISTLRGASMLPSFQFAVLDQVKQLTEDEVSTILPLDSNTVLLGGNLGVNILKNNSWVLKAGIEQENLSENKRISDALKIDPDKVYIAGTDLGLGVLSSARNLQWFDLPIGLQATSVAHWRGDIYVGTQEGKLLRFRNGTFTTTLDLKQPVYFRKIYKSASNDLHLLTNRGLFVYNGEMLKQIIEENPALYNLYSQLVWKGRTLIGTTAGLAELKEDRIVLISDPALKVTRPVYALLADSKDQVWIGTDKGAFVHKGLSLIALNQQHGMLGQELNRSALVEMPDGRIWIGTDKGVSIFNPQFEYKRRIIPKARLTSLKSDDRVLPMNDLVQLDHDQRALEFGFQAVTFYAPERLEFRYRLDGLEKVWNYSDNHLQNSVRYVSPPSGKYRFMLQARLAGGTWSPLVISPPVHIAPAFYTRWWFLGLAALLVGFLGYIVNSFIYQRNNEQRLQAAIDEKKTQIKQSESKFQSVWESMDSGLLVVNQQGKVQMVNPSFCRMFHCSPDSAVGKTLPQLVEHSKLKQSIIDNWFQNPALVKFEIDIAVGGLPLHLLVTFASLNIQSPKEPLLMIGMKDVSDKKETELKNLRLNELLVRQNRDLVKKELELAAFNQELLLRQTELQEALRVVEERNFELDQFVYKTSHDLRAPIASALGLLNIMRMEGQTPSWPGYIDMIIRSLEKQDSFIKAMLNFSKTARATDNPEPIDFEQLIDHCLNDLQYLQGFDDIQKRVRVKQHDAGFFSDRMKINIILSNILSNSIKYRDQSKTSRLDVSVEIDVDQAQITISDNGIGINKAYVKSIFDMFYRATERSDGSGLGLYIVRQTVERLGGTIEVTSELGIGSSFRISIPNRMSIAVAKEFMEQQDNESSTPVG